MQFWANCIGWAKLCLPHPFTIAVILTGVCFGLGLTCPPPTPGPHAHWLQVALYWEQGFWDLLPFAMQMTLILVLGHVMAQSRPILSIIHFIAKRCNSTAKAAGFVSFFSIGFALANWGLGLIFGAILARKIGEYAQQNRLPIHYPLIGASGYSGLLVWHAGLSGSAPLRVADPHHNLTEQIGVLPLTETVFSSLNLLTIAGVWVCIPLALYWIAHYSQPTEFAAYPFKHTDQSPQNDSLSKETHVLNRSFILCIGFGLCFVGVGLFKLLWIKQETGILAITPNFLNFMLFGSCLILHGRCSHFIAACERAIHSSVGIIIQFPLYAGIAGILVGSGLVQIFSDALVHLATDQWFPILVLISSGIVNFFVPSGGGQWSVQGPILIEAANSIGFSIPKKVLAFCYGDQLTNMIQPFWALPLLGITRLSPQSILPYTFFMMVIAFIFFSAGLLFF